MLRPENETCTYTSEGTVTAMSARQATRKTLRAAIAFALTYLMVWGGVPVPALVEMAEEAMGVREVAAPATSGDAVNENPSSSTPTGHADVSVTVSGDGELGMDVTPPALVEGELGFAPAVVVPANTDGEPDVQPESPSGGPEAEVAATVGAAALSTQATGDNIASGTWGTCVWEIDASGTLRVHAGEGASTSLEDRPPWSSWQDRIVAAVFDEGVRLPGAVLPCSSGVTGSPPSTPPAGTPRT